jgi:ubiquinone/menaquinone biosynthesis C-methylase UbiE
MLVRFLHWIASNGWVYDRIQDAAGLAQVRARLARHIPHELGRVLDVGGGTGAARDLWPAAAKYICLDIEPPKLAAFRSKVHAGIPLLADAAQMPIASGSVDALMCQDFSHHLPEAAFETALRECERVLKPGGNFVFIDALRNPDRRASRLLWSLDRGSHPHSAEQLTGLLGRYFEIVDSDRFAIYHEYLILVLRKRLEEAAP